MEVPGTTGLFVYVVISNDDIFCVTVMFHHAGPDSHLSKPLRFAPPPPPVIMLQASFRSNVFTTSI